MVNHNVNHKNIELINSLKNKEKIKILFVCLGNICRSPAAEGVMKKMLAEAGMDAGVLVDSAGIGPWHVGELPDSRMRRCGARRGYSFDTRARQVCRDDFSRFDIIVAMDNDNVRALKSLARNSEEEAKIVSMSDFLTAHKRYASVPDPYYGTERDFELALDLIEDGCRGLMNL